MVRDNPPEVGARSDVRAAQETHSWVAEAQRRIRFGIFGGGGPDWAAARDWAQTVQELGFDSLWVPDHPIGFTFDCWTRMIVLAETTRIAWTGIFEGAQSDSLQVNPEQAVAYFGALAAAGVSYFIVSLGPDPVALRRSAEEVVPAATAIWRPSPNSERMKAMDSRA